MAIPRICSIEGCGKPHFEREWCGMHYARWRAHGSPTGGGTNWRAPEKFINEVAMPYDGDDCLTWPFATDRFGYPRIRKDGRTVQVCRIICEATHGPAPTPDHHAAHSCGRGRDSCVAPHHISWKTRSENEADKLIHGTSNRGGRHGMAKLTEVEARQILRMKGAILAKDIAQMFSISATTVSRIHSRKVWAWL